MVGYLGLYSGSLTIDGAYLFTPAGGGGTRPEWATAWADFKNGEYYASGAATTLGAMWEADLDIGPFVVGDAVAGVGLYRGDGNGNSTPKLIDAIAAGYLDGFTGVMAWRVIDANPQEGIADFQITTPPLFTEGVSIKGTNFTGGDDPGVASVTEGAGIVSISPLAEVPGAGLNKIAFTINDSKVSVSLNGAVVETIDPTDFTATVIYLEAYSSVAVESIGLGAVQADAALPGLSA